MSMSATELAALPTAPAVSVGLREAARYADQGPHPALRRALLGTTSFEDFVRTVTPEHGIAEGVALIIVGGLVDPEVADEGWPDASWTASYFAQRVGHAHQVVTNWAASHSSEQLAHLLEAAADRAHALENAA
ncbi:hypothetical protein [Streptomyces lasiicapitis]|uniref:hypothetical protein n=1 Tax=Streptomyces lasiicapitis TaxID=1923961 RepID=UPI0036751325